MTRLAIVLPYFQRSTESGDLARTIASLQRDTFRDWHLLVVDDGSPVPVELEKYGLDERATCLRLPENGGIEGALNRGMTEVRARGFAYIARIDAGDEALNDRLAKQVAAFDADPELALVSSYAEVTDRDGNVLYVHQPPTEPGPLRRGMALQNFIVHTGVMLRASALPNGDPYRTDFRAAEDYELFYRIVSEGGKARTIPEVLVRFDTNPAGISGQRRRQQLISTVRVQLRYFTFRHWQSYAGVLRTALLFLLPRRWALQLKKALS